MPELPEVESIRRALLGRVVGRTVASATVLRRDIVIGAGDPAGGFSRQRAAKRHRPVPLAPGDLLDGLSITDIRRRGKQMAIIARDDRGVERALGIQLGMTGHVGFRGDENDTSHIHVEWSLVTRASRPGELEHEAKNTGAGRAPGPTSSDGTRRTHGRDANVTMLFSDPRRFGSIRVFRSLDALDALDEHWSLLGPDALTIAPGDLAANLAGSRRHIKAALLDQSVLAGVGNIYADEALFESRISPRALAARLKPGQTDALAAAIRRILLAACDSGGSTIRDYANADGQPGGYQAAHLVYGRAGCPCPRCRRPLATALIAQRTTVWCRACQP